jgi:hypothetical protein
MLFCRVDTYLRGNTLMDKRTLSQQFSLFFRVCNDQ